MAAFVISHVQKAAELIRWSAMLQLLICVQHLLESPRQAADSWASMWDFVSKGKLMLSFDRWGDGGRSGIHSKASASLVLKQSGNIFPYALHDGRAS